MKLIILIPAFNCSILIKKVIDPILKLNLDIKIIILNDGSTDDTVAVIKKIKSRKIKLYHNKKNYGYGYSSHKLYKLAKKLNAEAYISMHSDLGHRPNDLLKFIKFLKEKKDWDIVLGSRLLFLKNIINSKNFFNIFNKNYRGNMPLIILLGHLIITTFQNIILQNKLNSYHDGMRMIKKETLNWILGLKLPAWYDYDMVLLTIANKYKKKIFEIPIKPFYHKNIKSSVPLINYALIMLFNTIRMSLRFFEKIKNQS